VQGIFGIFGHGNVAGIGQALKQFSVDDPTLMPYYQARNEQAMVHEATAFARIKRRRATLACAASVGPGATNMLTGSGSNTFTMGTGSSGLSVAINGLVATFNTASTQFANAIRGTGTTLPVSQPIVPTSITYNGTSGTGAISTGSIGSILVATGGTSGTISQTGTNLLNIAIPSVGVYLITGAVRLRNDDVSGDVDRVLVNLGYGATGGVTSNIIQYTFGKVQFGGTELNGFRTDLPFSIVHSVSALGGSDNFVTLAVENDGNVKLILVSVTSTMRIVRIA
jgi:hypothetical protein